MELLLKTNSLDVRKGKSAQVGPAASEESKTTARRP